jgi:zinc and cadmium transporter
MRLGAAAVGFGTFLVIFLHKPFDSLTLGTLLSLGHWSTRTRHIVNLAFSMLIPFGIVLFYLGLSGWQDGQTIVSSALAFSAGTFLCIAMSDLLPELQFHQHDRVKLSGALLLGLALAWSLGLVEHGLEG